MRVMRSSNTVFSFFIIAVLLAGGVSLFGAGCSSNPAQHQETVYTIEQSFNYAQITAETANRAIRPLLDGGYINTDDAKSIRSSADIVYATIKRGRTVLDAGDAAQARAQLLAIAADLAYLNSMSNRSPK